MQFISRLKYFLLVLTIGTIMLVAGGCKRGAGDNTLYLPLFVKPLPTSMRLIPYISGFGNNTIVTMTHAGDDRLFVAVQSGLIHVIDQSGEKPKKLPTPFLDLQDRVQIDFEAGLIGLVFHPDYAENGFFYVTYNQKTTGKLILERYSVSQDRNVADSRSGLIMWAIDKPRNKDSQDPSLVHNAGDLHFGPDGYLYITIGDGGPDPFTLDIFPADYDNHGQRLDVLFGKMVRLDVTGNKGRLPDCGIEGYVIPDDNPFVDGLGGNCDEIWSYGWRNPWRFSFDSVTGNMWVADVGEWEAEEVNVELPGDGGHNYGWHCREGFVDFSDREHLSGHCDPDATYKFPDYVYDQSEGGCSAIGGYVYRGELNSALYGNYLFSDFCIRDMWLLQPDNLEAGITKLEYEIVAPWGDKIPQWTVIGEDVNGELYFGGYFHDAIYYILVP